MPIRSTPCGASTRRASREDARRVAGVHRAPASEDDRARPGARGAGLPAHACRASLPGHHRRGHQWQGLVLRHVGSDAARGRLQDRALYVAASRTLQRARAHRRRGGEKAGIFRAGRPAVIAEPNAPSSVLRAPGMHYLLGRDFGYVDERSQWTYWGRAGKRSGLAHPALRGAMQLRNAAAAMCALDCLREKLPLEMQAVRRGLAEVTLPARFQVLPGRPQIILDVAHNPEAAKILADNLLASGYAPQSIAVCGMLRDKDIAGVL